MKPQPWKTLGSRDILRDRWVRLRADRCEISPGNVVDTYYVMEEPEWVHVVAFDAESRVLLVRQYRHAVKAFSWELPGGAADKDEELLATAQRELLEESGAVGERWQHAGGYFSNPGRQNNRVHGFIAENVRVAQPQTLDATEAIECAFFAIPDVLALIQRGDFSNAMHVGLFYRALELLGRLQHR
jgi:8-oxo-dGTP pyrophosphatase MutT (NUDIX family)